MMTVGIDKIAMYTSHYALDLAVLAKSRNVDPEKFSAGLGQLKMSVPPPGEDVITLGANAALCVLQGEELNKIEMVLFATESGIDQSKAAAIFIHELLGLPAHCRCVELKQACYGATAGLQLSLPFLRLHPDKKILLIASDVARYGLNTPGESSQGCGAAAILLSANPRLMALEPEYGVVTESVMDFWRPNYLHEALVDGKYSSKIYLTALEKSWQKYQAASRRGFRDHDFFCYHTPVPRLVEKAHQQLRKINRVESHPAPEDLQKALDYCRQIGNSYTASLYISLISLLETTPRDLSGKRVGFYSYGSGCTAEYFSGIVQPTYESVLNRHFHHQMLTSRSTLSYEQYEAFYKFSYNTDGREQVIPDFKTGSFKLAKLAHHKRIYAKITNALPEQPKKLTSTQQKVFALPESVIRVNAPGKLILTGEHAVLYGSPALAMAINRYVTVTISRDAKEHLMFDFTDLAHRSCVSFHALRHLKARIKSKYHRFIRGDFHIRDVLSKPFELAQFALSVLAEALELSISHGAKIHLQSDIPIGCGMGSSAATIISVMQAMASYANTPLSNEEMFKLALEAENMQHGKSSGLDLRVALQGGCLYVQGNDFQRRAIPDMPLYLINTGTPESSTGQCVTAVSPYFESPTLRQEFAEVASCMDQALHEQSWSKMQAAIKENHQLLVRIGVVPEKVKQFIHFVELTDGAAKVCGAGTVSGNNAGAVLVTGQDKNGIEALCKSYGYSLMPINGVDRGVHAA